MESSELTFQYPSLSDRVCRQFEAFARILQQRNHQYNLTTITDTAAIFTRHFADSLAALPILDRLARKVESGLVGSLLDIGSGAGLPGLALAIARPNWAVVGIEATGKKVRFQQEVVTELRLSNVTLHHGRAEDLAHTEVLREAFDIVTARALAELRILVELAAGFLKPGGMLIAWKTAEIQTELDHARAVMGTLDFQIESTTPYTWPGQDKSDSNLRLITLIKKSPTDSRFPRSYARIKSDKGRELTD